MAEVIWQAMMGTGLAASAGLRAFLPLLVLGTAARFDVVALGERFTWMSSDAALIVFGVAVVLEVLGDKIPVVDHTLDVVGTLARPVAGALAAASPLTSLEPVTATVVGVILGASVAGGVHAAKATTRLVSTGATAGLATPFLSAGEDAVSFTGAVLAIFLPVVAFVAALIILLFVFRSRRPRTVSA
ncbi:MAG: DUF4126 family protein [Acidobacteria bacterium]|nr:DUF4126 family protein [Acidobacteriota bacterium]